MILGGLYLEGLLHGGAKVIFGVLTVYKLF